MRFAEVQVFCHPAAPDVKLDAVVLLCRGGRNDLGCHAHQRAHLQPQHENCVTKHVILCIVPAFAMEMLQMSNLTPSYFFAGVEEMTSGAMHTSVPTCGKKTTIKCAMIRTCVDAELYAVLGLCW
jgi:hypothetical protein